MKGSSHKYRRKNRKTKIIVAFMLFCALCSGCSSTETDDQTISLYPSAGQLSAINRDSKTPEIITLHGEFVYDTGNIYEAVGIHDHVFAGVVTAINGVEYPLEQSCTNNDGEEAAASGPMFTSISISVTEVIKGDLATGDQIDTYKLGGYNNADGLYYLLDNDVYPEVGKEYLFLASTDSEGVFWMSEPNTVIPLEPYNTMISTYSSSDQTAGRQTIISAYMEAYQNEIPYTGEIFENSAFPETAVIED